MTMPVCLLLALMATSVNAFVPMTPVLAARTGVGLRAASSRPVRAQTTAMVLKPEYLEGTGGPPAAGQGEWGTPQPAPSFDLPSDSGASVSLESLAGKWLVLYFYPKADSQGCTLQAQNYQADIEDYRKTGAEIIGISTDPVDKLQAFKAKHKLTYPLLSDKDASVIKAYDSALSLPFLGTFANRNTYIIDPQGNLREAYAKVDPKMDSIVAFARLKELQNPK